MCSMVCTEVPNQIKFVSRPHPTGSRTDFLSTDFESSWDASSFCAALTLYTVNGPEVKYHLTYKMTNKLQNYPVKLHLRRICHISFTKWQMRFTVTLSDKYASGEVSQDNCEANLSFCESNDSSLPRTSLTVYNLVPKFNTAYETLSWFQNNYKLSMIWNLCFNGGQSICNIIQLLLNKTLKWLHRSRYLYHKKL
jgi:hypothetical protein